MSFSAWALHLTNPYALIGFVLLVLGVLARASVGREKFSTIYVVCFAGVAIIVVGVMLVILLDKGGSSDNRKEKSVNSTATPSVSPSFVNNGSLTVNGSGNTIINNSGGSVSVKAGINRKP